MKLLCIFIWIILINLLEAFLFTITKNNALGSCEPNFLCPPMCLKNTPTGCQCDCSHMDPSHPEHLGGNPYQQPNSAGYGVQNGGGCNTNWMNCQPPCAAAVNPTSGCVECNCPQLVTTQPPATQSSTTPTVTSSKKLSNQPSTSPQVTTQQKTSQTTMTSLPPQSTKTIAPVTTSKASISSSTPKTTSSAGVASLTTSPSTVMTTSGNSCQGAIQCIMNCKNGFVIDPVPAADGCPKCSCKPAQSTTTGNNPTTPFQTVSFPVHLTTPHQTITTPTTTRPSSSTLHRIVCPGVFNCSKTCYTGYRLDSQGCPLCECAPMPTGLP